MRFYLDNDVDIRCRAALQRLDSSHVVYTANEAGRSDADDDEQTVYASERDAVLITHDREFTERRKRNSIGRHVRLDCEQPDGPEILTTQFPEVLAELERHANIVVELSRNTHKSTIRWD